MKSIPYGHQYIDQRDIGAVLKILKSDWITQGPQINKFEEGLCEYTGARFAVAVSSGTAALHIAAMACGLRSGQQVITSPITFAASVNCILYCSARPVFADIEADTLNIDARQIEGKITSKTRAIIAVHFGGHPCDMSAINKIARRYNLMVIEDAAHALGAEYKGVKIGAGKYSDMTIFSFHPVKAITTGEGGAILTNNRRLWEKMILLRNHGITKEKARMSRYEGYWYYQMQELGFNYRITDIQAALGFSQLKKLDRFIKKRREIALVYNRAFKVNPYFDIPTEREYAYSAYHLYPIRINEIFRDKKRMIFQNLREKGIGVQVHYIPVYLHPYYRRLGFRRGLCPKAEDAYIREISLPIYPLLKKAQVDYIINGVLGVFRKLNCGE